MEDKLEGLEYRNENHEQLPLKPEVGKPEIKKLGKQRTEDHRKV